MLSLLSEKSVSFRKNVLSFAPKTSSPLPKNVLSFAPKTSSPLPKNVRIFFVRKVDIFFVRNVRHRLLLRNRCKTLSPKVMTYFSAFPPHTYPKGTPKVPQGRSLGERELHAKRPQCTPYEPPRHNGVGTDIVRSWYGVDTCLVGN